MFQQVRRLCDLNKYTKLLNAGKSFYSNKKGNDELDKLKSNPFYQKYSDKIKKTTTERYISKLSTETKQQPRNIENKFKKFKIGDSKPKLTSNNIKRKTLDSLLKMDLIKNKSSTEISQIWREYHKKQDKISAIIPAPIYSVISERAKEFPVFLYPIPRGDGYEFIMAQFDNDDCHFTALINYQTYKENAPECLTICHYPDLVDERGIVLMRGEFNCESLNAYEARFLANQMQLYYTSKEKDAKFSLLETFTKRPDRFKHMDLIKQLETIPFEN